MARFRPIGKSDRTLPVASWLPADEWAAAPEPLRRKLIDFACRIAKLEKIKQLANGIGADGRKLAKVQPKSRPDRSTGAPLSPHRSDSRSQKWCRVVPGYVAGTVTVTWSHGWLAILTYHAEGRVIGAYIRNVLEYPKAVEARIKAAVRHHWRSLLRMHAILPTPTRINPPAGPPKGTPPAAPALPMFPRRRPIRPGVAAAGALGLAALLAALGIGYAVSSQSNSE